MLSKTICIESKLHEHVHLRSLLTIDQSLVVLNVKLIKSEECHVGKDLIQGHIVTVKAARIALIEDPRENLKQRDKYSNCRNKQ